MNDNESRSCMALAIPWFPASPARPVRSRRVVHGRWYPETVGARRAIETGIHGHGARPLYIETKQPRLFRYGPVRQKTRKLSLYIERQNRNAPGRRRRPAARRAGPGASPAWSPGRLRGAPVAPPAGASRLCAAGCRMCEPGRHPRRRAAARAEARELPFAAANVASWRLGSGGVNLNGCASPLRVARVIGYCFILARRQ